MGQDIKLTASDGFKFGGYRADPAGAPKAAIVVIQEIFGVNHHIRSVCDRLAAEGYVAIAPSIFDRIQPDFQCGYSPDEIATAWTTLAKANHPHIPVDRLTPSGPWCVLLDVHVFRPCLLSPGGRCVRMSMRVYAADDRRVRDPHCSASNLEQPLSPSIDRLTESFDDAAAM